MVKAAPLEQDPAGREVDFLEDRVGDGAALGAADGAQIDVRRDVRGEQRGPLRREQKLVEISL